MFDELTKYENNNHFFFTAKEELTNVCNAPKNKSGVYLVYELKNGKIELVYIGSSGNMLNDGKIKHQKGGLFDKIVNEHHFNETLRKKSWKQKIKDEKIDALDIYWYDTFNSANTDIPAYVEAVVMQRFFNEYGCLPRWNNEF